MKNKDIFDRLKAREPIRLDVPEYPKGQGVVDSTISLSAQLNSSASIGQIRNRLGEIIAAKVDETTTVLAPVYTNFGKFLTIGKRVFINHACSFHDMGGITIGDDVLVKA